MPRLVTKSPFGRCLSASLLFLSAGMLRATERVITIDQKKSLIEYHVRAPLASFGGTLNAYETIITADPARPGQIGRAELRFRFTDLRSGNVHRDQDMRDWQNTEQFPECIFTLTGLAPAGGPTLFTARGQFLFHGQAREVTFPVTISSTSEGQFSIKGDALIDTRDYGLPAPRRWGLLKVDPVVKVSLALVANTPTQ